MRHYILIVLTFLTLNQGAWANNESAPVNTTAPKTETTTTQNTENNKENSKYQSQDDFHYEIPTPEIVVIDGQEVEKPVVENNEDNSDREHTVSDDILYNNYFNLNN